MYLPENSAAMCCASADDPPLPQKMTWLPARNASSRMSAALLICAGSMRDMTSAALSSSALMASFIGVPPRDDAPGLENEVDRPRPELAELLGDIVLAVVFAYEVHEPATPGPRDLAAYRPGALGRVVHPVDGRVGDLVGEALLVVPPLVEDLPGLADPAPLHGDGHLDGQLLGPVQGLLVLALVELGHLALYYAGGVPAAPEVAQEGAVLQLVGRVLPDPDAVDLDALAEGHEVEPAEHGGVLVLLAALQADVLPLQLVGQLGHLPAGQADALPLADGGYYRDYDRGRPAQAGAGRGLRLQEHLEAVGDPEVVGDGLDEVHVPVQGQRAAVQRRLVLPVVGGVHGHGVVPGGGDGAVGVPVDRGVEDGPSLPGGVGVDVGPPAGQAYPQGGPRPVMQPIH